jgi:SMC interacting uncharacterized protein involved in chromosome segregation
MDGQLRTPRPSKATKLSLATKDEEIQNLKAQIAELHAFIISQGLEASEYYILGFVSTAMD